MPITSRHYIFEEGGAIRKVSRAVIDGLVFGKDALPEYAGTRQRIATAIVENEDGKPVRLLAVEGSLWQFDEDGKIDKALRASAAEAMAFAFPHASPHASGKVVDISDGIKKRNWQARHRWAVSQDDVNRIAADIWPDGQAAGENLKFAKGQAPRKPPMTREGERALREFSGHIYSIARELEELSEAALKGLAFELRNRTDAEPDVVPIWAGIAAACDYRREIKARYRTGRGAWYAELDVIQWQEGRTGRTVHDIQIKCGTRQEAVETARRLLAENAHWFTDDTTVEASIRSELEISGDAHEATG